MADLTIKAHDNYPALNATLTANGTAIDLTTAISVKIILKGTTLLITGTCTIVTPASGIISYTWATTDLAVADTYQVEFEITWPSSKIQTVPNSGTNSILVVADLEGA